MMQFQQVGGTPVPTSPGIVGTPNVVYPTFQASAASLKPDEYQFAGRIMGHYSAAGFTSAALQAANGIMAAFRVADPTAFAVIKRVRVAAAVVAAVTAQQVDCDMVVVRNYSVRDLTNATVIPITTDTGKMRQAMGPSVLAALAGGNFDVSNAAAGLTGGTGTADAAVTGAAPVPLVAFTAGAASPYIEIFDSYQPGQHPLILRANEGFRIRNTTVIATGTLRYYVAVDWLEAVAY